MSETLDWIVATDRKWREREKQLIEEIKRAENDSVMFRQIVEDCMIALKMPGSPRYDEVPGKIQELVDRLK